jgi:hypothetical protein
MQIHIYGINGYSNEKSEQTNSIIKRIPGNLEIRNRHRLSIIPQEDDKNINIDDGYIIVGLSELSDEQVLSAIEPELNEIGITLAWK